MYGGGNKLDLSGNIMKIQGKKFQRRDSTRKLFKDCQIIFVYIRVLKFVELLMNALIGKNFKLLKNKHLKWIGDLSYSEDSNEKGQKTSLKWILYELNKKFPIFFPNNIKMIFWRIVVIACNLFHVFQIPLDIALDCSVRNQT